MHMNNQVMIDLSTEAVTEGFARVLARCLTPPLVLTFSGDIGAGKTTLIRAMIRALGIQTAIKSPTFSLVETYQSTLGHIHHFDLYRIVDEAELDYIGFRDYFRDNAICCIEWPEQAPTYLLQTDLRLTLSVKGAGRVLHCSAMSAAGEAVLSCLIGEL